MDLKEFEHQVIAGEITDFEPYFEDGSLNYHLRYILAKNGIEVDRIIEKDGPGAILGFIKDKVHVDRYEEWKDHPLVDIRKELAKAGYFQDDFINDPNVKVREAVIENDMHQGLKRLHDKDDRQNIKHILLHSMNPDVDLLSAYIDASEKYQNSIHDYPEPALELKLKGMRYIPTAIEKTMSEKQLFETGCPLWTKKYTPNKIFYIIKAQRNLTKQGFTDFNNVLYDVIKENKDRFHKESFEELTIKLLNERN